MRDPLRRLLICASLFVVAAGAAWLALSDGSTASALIGILGLGVAFTAFFVGLDAAYSLRNYYRLSAGRGAIASWHVTAEEWDRFRALDRARARQERKLSNDFPVRRHTPSEGVDIVVGPEHILVDGSYQKLHLAVPDGRAVCWLDGDPDCLEFPIYYGPTRGLPPSYYTLRIPVPVSARAEGRRVLEYFRINGPQPSVTNA
jgi:hypothetical protein